MYAKEAQEQQAKLDKATAEGKDEYDVKNQVSRRKSLRSPRYCRRSGPSADTKASPALTLCLAHVQQRILQDCAQMIPDSQRRLEAAVEDLEIYLVSRKRSTKAGRTYL